MTIFPVLEKTSKKQNKKETNKQAKKLKKKKKKITYSLELSNFYKTVI